MQKINIDSDNSERLKVVAWLSDKSKQDFLKEILDNYFKANPLPSSIDIKKNGKLSLRK